MDLTGWARILIVLNKSDKFIFLLQRNSCFINSWQKISLILIKCFEQIELICRHFVNSYYFKIKTIKGWWYIFWKPILRKLGTYYSLNTLLVSGLVDKRKNHKTVSLEIRKYYCSLSQYFFGCSKSKADNGNCAVIGAVFFSQWENVLSHVFFGESGNFKVNGWLQGWLNDFKMKKTSFIHEKACMSQNGSRSGV